jgi:hypothetical protein
VFLGRRVAGTVEHVEEGGRRLVVATDDGGAIAFVLAQASARFVEEARGTTGARLIFEDDEPG